MSEDKYSCPNCETEHDTKEEATECCQCWSCVELNATIKELEDQLKLADEINQSLRDSQPNDHIKELEAKLERITEIIGMEDGGRIDDAYDRIVELMEDAG